MGVALDYLITSQEVMIGRVIMFVSSAGVIILLESAQCTLYCILIFRYRRSCYLCGSENNVNLLKLPTTKFMRKIFMLRF